MAEHRVRYLTLDHKPSLDEYVVMSKPSIRGMVPMRNVRTGETITIQKRRILPLNTAGKAIAASHANKTTIACPIPQCILELQILDTQTASCGEHGTFAIYPYNVDSLPPQSTNQQVSKPARKEKIMSNVQVDLEEIKKYGELWVRRSEFNHAAFDVRSYVLVADGPPRKLCFNTYNGSLGKRSKNFIEELRLAEFQNNDTIENSKYKVYVSKRLEDIHNDLKKEFEKV